MKLGTYDWEELDMEGPGPYWYDARAKFSTGDPILDDNSIIVYDGWCWVTELRKHIPQYLQHVHINNQHIWFVHITVYRAARLYHQHQGYAEMPFYEFLERTIGQTPPNIKR